MRWSHRDLARKLGGAITFVGAVPTCNVFVVGLAATHEYEENAFAASHPEVMMPEMTPVRGPIVLVGSGDDGDETDVDIDRLRLGIS